MPWPKNKPVRSRSTPPEVKSILTKSSTIYVRLERDKSTQTLDDCSWNEIMYKIENTKAKAEELEGEIHDLKKALKRKANMGSTVDALRAESGAAGRHPVRREKLKGETVHTAEAGEEGSQHFIAGSDDTGPDQGGRPENAPAARPPGRTQS